MGHDEAGTCSFSRACYNIAELRQQVQDAWNNLSQGDIWHLNDRLHSRMHACVAARGCYTIQSEPKLLLQKNMVNIGR